MNSHLKFERGISLKRNFILLILLTALLVLAACGTGKNDTKDLATGDEQEPVVENNEESTDDNEVPDETEDMEDQANGEASDENEDKETMTATGIYNGQADPHTIEVETEDGPTAFQLTMDARDDVEHLRIDEEVTYTYYEDGEQLVIESIHLIN